MNKKIARMRSRSISRKDIRDILSRVNSIMIKIELKSFNKETIKKEVPTIPTSLKSEGLKLGITTHGFYENTEMMKKNCIDNYFNAIIYGYDVEEQKSSSKHALQLLKIQRVPATQALLVGDHLSDAECAKNSGLRFILVEKEKENLPVNLREFCFKVIRNLNDSFLNFSIGV